MLRQIWFNLVIKFGIVQLVPVPVTARSEALVCGLSPAEIIGFASHRGDGCLSVVSVVCCQVEVSATS